MCMLSCCARFGHKFRGGAAAAAVSCMGLMMWGARETRLGEYWGRVVQQCEPQLSSQLDNCACCPCRCTPQNDPLHSIKVVNEDTQRALAALGSKEAEAAFQAGGGGK